MRRRRDAEKYTYVYHPWFLRQGSLFSAITLSSSGLIPTAQKVGDSSTPQCHRSGSSEMVSSTGSPLVFKHKIHCYDHHLDCRLKFPEYEQEIDKLTVSESHLLNSQEHFSL
ncbi:hypothetical protein CRM22_007809 [Opisthorchis felineus]|uniref:Uncharacterized protein n=1 Tax=Opisthorchis felineus TaxID=147828 RepID=A0A4V6RGV6_OPIFE|nr:hypothetical protein CRM22_007809 [Opisthorchis felineus]